MGRAPTTAPPLAGPGVRAGIPRWAALGVGGYACALGAGLCWSTTGVFIRLLGREGMGPFACTLGRAAVASALIALGSAAFDRRLLAIRARELPGLSVLAVCSVLLSQGMFMYCISRVPLAVAVVLNYTNPMFVALIAWLVLRQRLGWRHVLALALTMAGVVLVTGLVGGPAAAGGAPALAPGPSGPREPAPAAALPPLAVAAGLVSGLGYAVLTVLADRLIRDRSPLTLHFWTMTLGGAALLAVLLLAGAPLERPASGTGWLELLGLGAVPGLLGFYLYITGVRAIAPHRAAIVATVEPVAAGLLGYLAFGEELTGLQVLGMVLVLAAIFLVSLGKRASPGGAEAAGGRVGALGSWDRD
ncbi:MAG: DMT family transporter [Acetobacteraceae bacterium]|nr:DMT family transporter [Acetobacteraceae bacterium]